MILDPSDRLPAAHEQPTRQQQQPTAGLLDGLRDGAWLDAQTFPPLRYAVPGLIPEGSTLLVGPPKIGKSWFVLDLALAIAAGGRALGAISTGEPRHCLYLALEDGDRRLQDRCRKLLDGQPIPERFHYLTRVETGRAVETVETWTEQHPGASLVILDTLGKVMPPAMAGESAYQRDYRIGSRLKRVVDDRPGLALLTNHHDRKAEAADFVDAVSGTHGLAGSADSVLVLSRKRHEDDGLLQLTSRDAPEGAYAVSNDDGVRWTLAGGTLSSAARQAATVRATAGLGDRMAEVVAHVASTDEPCGPSEVADALDLGADTAGRYLRRATEAGRIERVGRGRYAPPSTPVRSVRVSETDGGTGHTDTTDTGRATPDRAYNHGKCATCGRRSFADPCRDCQEAAA